MQTEGDCRQISCCSGSDGNFIPYTYSLVSGQSYVNDEMTFTIPCPPGYNCTGPTITITIPPGNIKYTPVDFDPGDPPIVGDPWNPGPGTYTFNCGAETLVVVVTTTFTAAQITQIINFLASCQAVVIGKNNLQPTPTGFTNSEVIYTPDCESHGALLVVTGALPYWVMVREVGDGENVVVGRAGTYSGDTQLAADNAAQTALANFVSSGFASGLFSCRCFDNEATLPAATVGVPYSVFLVPSLGVPGTTSITTGDLPDGLTLNPFTHEISGTPTVSASFGFTATFTPL